MKRMDCCLCAPHVARILVIAVITLSVCLNIAIKSMAQGKWEPPYIFGREECLDFDCTNQAGPIYDGRVILRMPIFRLQPQSLPDIKGKNGEGLDQPLPGQGLDQPLPDTTLDVGQDIQPTDATDSFDWNNAIAQSTLFLAICHGFRFATEAGTRSELRGPFFKDYWASLRSLRGWGDGDEFLVNYIGHPMGGSVAGYIQIQNDPKGIKQEVGLNNKKYWKSRMRAMAWAAAYSTQFELGPISEASLGNVGQKPTDKSRHPMGWVDLIITPTMGTAWLVGEDLLDRYLIRWLESKIKNRTLIIAARTFLNPTRSFANMHRGDLFWKRENRP
jgi:hypothetical protein